MAIGHRIKLRRGSATRLRGAPPKKMIQALRKKAGVGTKVRGTMKRVKPITGRMKRVKPKVRTKGAAPTRRRRRRR